MNLIPYSAQVEDAMQRYYWSLSEKDRRRYAAIEALKLGYGGISYIARLFNCTRHTIHAGLRELQSDEALNQTGERSAGGGRKTAWDTYPDLDRQFWLAISPYQVRRMGDRSVVALSRRQIIKALAERGIQVSATVIVQLLKKHRVTLKSRNYDVQLVQVI